MTKLSALPLSAAASVFAYPKVAQLLPLAAHMDRTDLLGQRVAEAAQVMSTYRGYVWVQWFAQNMSQQWTAFAVLLGAGGLLAQASGGAALFTLSLPTTRERLARVRAATGLIELLVLALLALGLYGMLAKRNLAKKVIGMAIFQTAIFLFFIEGSVKQDATVPIIDPELGSEAVFYVNPLPHLLILPAIVVGVAVIGVALAFLISIHRANGTLDEDEVIDSLVNR